MDQVYIGTTSYGKHWLDRPAAESWFRMVRDGCPSSGITDAGRTPEEQIAVFLKYFTTDYAASAKHDRRVWQGRTYWRRPGKPSAATPGSPQARHTFGRALDLNGATKAWVRANGARYGWIKDLVRGEDWHMEYQSSRDVVEVSNPGEATGDAPSAPNTKPIQPIDPIHPETDSEGDEPMRYLIQIDPAIDGRWFLVDYATGTAQRIYNGAQLDLIRRDPRVDQVVGPQTPSIIAGLRVTGE